MRLALKELLPSRRWFQFSLRSLLLAMTLASLPLGYIAHERQDAQRHQQIAAALETKGIWILPGPKSRQPAMSWLLGDDTLTRGVGIDIEKRQRVLLSEQDTAFAAAQLKNFPDMLSLDFSETRISDASLRDLQGLYKLTHLHLARTKITDAGVPAITALKQLKDLNLSGTKVTDAGVAELQKLTELRVLGLGQLDISDSTLVNLRGLSKLEDLDLGGAAITDQGLKELRNFPKLQTLELSATNITSSGLKELGSLKQLRILGLCGNQLAQPGVTDLAQLDSLSDVYLTLSDVSEVDKAQLQRALPKARIW